MGDSPTVLTRRRLLQSGGVGAAALLLPALPAAIAEATATPTAAGIAADPMGRGYWIAMSDGRVIPRGNATRVGGAPAFSGTATGIAAVTKGGGFWRLQGNGRTTGVGTATLRGGALSNRDSRVVGAAPTPSGRGMWRVTSKGTVVATGTAPVLGEPRTDFPIVGIAAHPEAGGYWLLNSRGRVFAYGASRVLGTPVGSGATGIASHPSGDGYWVVRSTGIVSAFGVAAHHGNANLDSPIVDIAPAPDGAGYWLLTRDGRVRPFGSARTGIFSIDPPPAPTVATVGGIVVDSAIASRLRGLLAHARDDGFRLGGWGYRSYQRQVELREQNCGPRYYDVYVKRSSECSPMTARPGASMHEQGRAIDFHRIRADGTVAPIAGTAAFRWMAVNAKAYGLYNLPAEPWHWSTNGR